MIYHSTLCPASPDALRSWDRLRSRLSWYSICVYTSRCVRAILAHANFLCINLILTDDPRRESNAYHGTVCDILV